MKTPVILAALLLASGLAMAENGHTVNTDNTASSGTKMSISETGDSIGAKTKRGVHKTGDALKRTGHKMADATRHLFHRDGTQTASSRSDTTSMGAAPADSPRQQRMDGAYSNWQRKNNK